MRKMLGILLPAILLALAVAEAQDKPTPKPSDTTDKMLIANERALQDAVANTDKTSFRSLVAPGGIWTTKQGFIPMELLVGGLEGFELTKWDIVNPHVTWINDDSAIVLYSWTGAGTFNRQPLASTTLASTVWTRRSGKWLAIHHQQTDLVKN